MRVALLSTYDLGRQPFGLASSAAWLREWGADVTLHDLAVTPLDRTVIDAADLVAFHVPMHTATRLAAELVPLVRVRNPHAHICCFGLYASLNDALLRSLGVDTVISGEFEAELVALCQRLAGGPAPSDGVAEEPVVSLERLRFRIPDRRGLPLLDRYAQLRTAGGGLRTVGYTEASRGCKHQCRHCPIVPVYGGRFRIVQPEVVIADIAQQVDAGAEHITFGDPDFLNGPRHGMRILHLLQERFPDLTYDVTVKVQHLVEHADLIPELAESGCLFVTSAVESFDDHVLNRLEKHHSAHDFQMVVERFRAVGLHLNPTFVAFTPWTSLAGYAAFLGTIHRLGLVDNVAPIQYAIRLLVTTNSRLLELPEIAGLVDGYDRQALVHPWKHPDRRVDELYEWIAAAVARCQGRDAGRRETFAAICDIVRRHLSQAGLHVELPQLEDVADPVTVPYLTEPWYC